MAQEVYKQMLEVMLQRRGSYAGMDIPEFYILMKMETTNYHDRRQ
jgi:hypothetical protein